MLDGYISVSVFYVIIQDSGVLRGTFIRLDHLANWGVYNKEQFSLDAVLFIYLKHILFVWSSLCSNPKTYLKYFKNNFKKTSFS